MQLRVDPLSLLFLPTPGASAHGSLAVSVSSSNCALLPCFHPHTILCCLDAITTLARPPVFAVALLVHRYTDDTRTALRLRTSYVCLSLLPPVRHLIYPESKTAPDTLSIGSASFPQIILLNRSKDPKPENFIYNHME